MSANIDASEKDEESHARTIEKKGDLAMHEDSVEAKLPIILAKSPAEETHLEPLPAIDIQEVIGLCELLQEHGGRVNFYDSGYLRLMLLAAEGGENAGARQAARE